MLKDFFGHPAGKIGKSFKRPLNHAIEFRCNSLRVLIRLLDWQDAWTAKRRILRRFLLRTTDGTMPPDRRRVRFSWLYRFRISEYRLVLAFAPARVVEQPVAATNDKRVYAVFTEIVVDGPSAVLDKANQFRPDNARPCPANCRE